LLLLGSAGFAVAHVLDPGWWPEVLGDDPHVLGTGADLGDTGALTAVLDRDTLPYLTIEFAARPLDE